MTLPLQSGNSTSAAVMAPESVRSDRSLPSQTWGIYAEMLRRHPVVASLAFLVVAAVLVEVHWYGQANRRIAYVLAMGGGVLITDLVISRKRTRPTPLVVRRPAWELSVAAGIYLVTLALAMNRFHWHWHDNVQAIHAVSNIAILVFLLFQIPLLAFLVAGMKYRFREIGFRFYGTEVAFYVLPCFALLATVSHTWTPWQAVRYEFGSPTSLVASAFTAAFSEEVLRVVWQTRLASLLKNPAVAWFVTAWVWSLLHYPMYGSLQACLQIVPEGLMWGYIMFRTKSVAPTMVLHMTNFLWLFKALPT